MRTLTLAMLLINSAYAMESAPTLQGVSSRQIFECARALQGTGFFAHSSPLPGLIFLPAPETVNGHKRIFILTNNMVSCNNIEDDNANSVKVTKIHQVNLRRFGIGSRNENLIIPPFSSLAPSRGEFTQMQNIPDFVPEIGNGFVVHSATEAEEAQARYRQRLHPNTCLGSEEANRGLGRLILQGVQMQSERHQYETDHTAQNRREERIAALNTCQHMNDPILNAEIEIQLRQITSSDNATTEVPVHTAPDAGTR